MVSMAWHILQDAVRTRSMRQNIMFCATHNIEQRSFFNEINTLAAQSDGILRIIWVVSYPEDHAKEGDDYHVKGTSLWNYCKLFYPLMIINFICVVPVVLCNPCMIYLSH